VPFKEEGGRGSVLSSVATKEGKKAGDRRRRGRRKANFLSRRKEKGKRAKLIGLKRGKSLRHFSIHYLKTGSAEKRGEGGRGRGGKIGGKKGGEGKWHLVCCCSLPPGEEKKKTGPPLEKEEERAPFGARRKKKGPPNEA